MVVMITLLLLLFVATTTHLVNAAAGPPLFSDLPRDARPTADSNGVAVVVSGGGTRAAMGTLAALNHLETNGLLHDVSYLVGLSGGGWGATMYKVNQCARRSAADVIQRIRDTVQEQQYWGDVVPAKRKTTKGGISTFLIDNWANIKWGWGGVTVRGWRIGGKRNVDASYFHDRWAAGVGRTFLAGVDEATTPVSALTCPSRGGPEVVLLLDKCAEYHDDKCKRGAMRHLDHCIADASHVECFDGSFLDNENKFKEQLKCTFPIRKRQPKLSVFAARSTNMCFHREDPIGHADKPTHLNKKDSHHITKLVPYLLKDLIGSTGAAYLGGRREHIKARVIGEATDFVNLQPPVVYDQCVKPPREKMFEGVDLILPPDDGVNSAQFCDAGITCNLPLAFLQFRPGAVKTVLMFDYTAADYPFAPTDYDIREEELYKCIKQWQTVYHWVVELKPPNADGVRVMTVMYPGVGELEANRGRFATTDEYATDAVHYATVIFVPFGRADQFEKWCRQFPTISGSGTDTGPTFVTSIETGNSPKGQVELFDDMTEFYHSNRDTLTLDASTNPLLRECVGAEEMLAEEVFGNTQLQECLDACEDRYGGWKTSRVGKRQKCEAKCREDYALIETVAAPSTRRKTATSGGPRARVSSSSTTAKRKLTTRDPSGCLMTSSVMRGAILRVIRGLMKGKHAAFARVNGAKSVADKKRMLTPLIVTYKKLIMLQAYRHVIAARSGSGKKRTTGKSAAKRPTASRGGRKRVTKRRPLQM